MIPKLAYVAIAAVVVVIILAYFLIGSAAAPIVATGDNISVYYTGAFTNGTVFNSNAGGQPLNFTVGSGQVIPGFDQAVIGMKLNETKNVTVPVNEAYGPVDPARILDVPTSKFGNQTVTKGMIITSTQNGQQFQGIVTAVNATNATVDFNSPLAGKTLVFSIRVVKI